MILNKTPFLPVSILAKCCILYSLLLSIHASGAPADGVVSWSDTDRDENIVLSNNDLDVEVPSSAESGVFAVRSNQAINPGDGFFYVEIERLSGDGEFVVGGATVNVPLTASSPSLIINNSEAAVSGQIWEVISLAIDYRGTSPVVYFFGDRFGSTPNYTQSISLDSVSGPLYLYLATERGNTFNLNFGGVDGDEFFRDPSATVEQLIFNGGSLLEFGMPVPRTKPVLTIIEGNQLVQQNATATFTATAVDNDSTNLATSVEWFLEGVSIGVGSTISPATSVAGRFTLEARVQDVEELLSTATVNFYVHPSVDGDNLDYDLDGLTYTQELAASTNPALFDTDGDGLSDGYEIANSYSPTNSNDPAVVPITLHEDDVFFNFENELTSPIVSTSDDGLSVGYIPFVDGKAAIRSNQGMRGEFRYWEGRVFFDDDIGTGFISSSEPINDYCCVTFPSDNQDFSDPTAPGSSMSVNTAGANSIWENLVQQSNYTNNDFYIGLAVDYIASPPVVYVIGSAGIEETIILSDFASLDSIFPMFYGNANENINGERGPVAVQRANFGQEPFFYDIEQVLSDAVVPNLTSFMPGWGRYSQRQSFNLNVVSLDATVGSAETISATASSDDGSDITDSIDWMVLDDANNDVSDIVITSAAPFEGGSIDIVLNRAAGFTVVAIMQDSKTGEEFSRSIPVTAGPFPGDTTPPSFTSLPSELTVEITSGSSAPASLSGIQTFLSAPVAIDNSGFVTVTNNAPTDFPLGPTTVIFTAEDGANNVTATEILVNVVSLDDVPPSVDAPNDINIDLSDAASIPASNPIIAAFLSGATASDTNDGVLTASATGNNLAAYPVGITEVTFSATDAAGNIGTDIASITIIDTGLPEVSVPDNLTMATSFGTSISASNPLITTFLSGASANDIVDGDLPVTIVSGDLSDYPLGVTTVIFSATDAAGNVGTTPATITITDGVPPIVTPPANISVDVATGNTISASDPVVAAFLSGATATDGVDGSLSVSITENDLSNYPMGSTEVTFTATDDAGNSASAMAVITVSDIGSPVITPPADITLFTAESSIPRTDQRIVNFLAGVSIEDNVNTIPLEEINAIAPNEFPLGFTVVSFLASDLSGNEAITKTALVNVVSTVLAAIDTDGDGLNDDDPLEGFGDDDNDRIPNYLENNSDPEQNDPTQIQAGHNNAYLKVGPGLKLVLGETSFVSGNPSSLVSREELVANAGAGGTEAENADDEFYNYPSGVYDFEVWGLTPGASAQVVIPLSTAIPEGAVYRKFLRGIDNGWSDFDLSSDQVASAPGSLGVCPDPGDPSYTTGVSSSGLTEGHFCVQLTIQDGGPNDADGLANGVIKDPSGVAVVIDPPSLTLNKSSTDTTFVNEGGLETVLAFNVVSDSSDAQINSLTISASGDLDEVGELASVRLYRDGAEQASSNYLVNDGQITFNFATPLRLDEGDNRFSISYEF